MYNRYLRNDDDVYTRIPMQDTPQDAPHDSTPPPPQRDEMPRGGSTRESNQPRDDIPPHRGAFGDEQFLRRLLGKFNLKNIDTADILLLLILFFLFEEKADDELLVALGLLLIL